MSQDTSGPINPAPGFLAGAFDRLDQDTSRAQALAERFADEMESGRHDADSDHRGTKSARVAIANELAQTIAAACPEGIGFALMIFDFDQSGAGGGMTWVSNASRLDMIATIEEMIEKLKELPPETTTQRG